MEGEREARSPGERLRAQGAPYPMASGALVSSLSGEGGSWGCQEASAPEGAVGGPQPGAVPGGLHPGRQVGGPGHGCLRWPLAALEMLPAGTRASLVVLASSWARRSSPRREVSGFAHRSPGAPQRAGSPAGTCQKSRRAATPTAPRKRSQGGKKRSAVDFTGFILTLSGPSASELSVPGIAIRHRPGAAADRKPDIPARWC